MPMRRVRTAAIFTLMLATSSCTNGALDRDLANVRGIVAAIHYSEGICFDRNVSINETKKLRSGTREMSGTKVITLDQSWLPAGALLCPGNEGWPRYIFRHLSIFGNHAELELAVMGSGGATGYGDHFALERRNGAWIVSERRRASVI